MKVPGRDHDRVEGAAGDGEAQRVGGRVQRRRLRQRRRRFGQIVNGELRIECARRQSDV